MMPTKMIFAVDHLNVIRYIMAHHDHDEMENALPFKTCAAAECVKRFLGNTVHHINASREIKRARSWQCHILT